MGIDLRTFIFILGITHLMQVVVFFYQYKANKNIPGPLYWLLWSAAEVLGFAFILLRNIPELLPVAILFQNIILLAGTLFIYIGLLRFLKQKVKLKFIILFFSCYLFLHLFFIYIWNDINIRSAIIASFLAFISFLTAFSINKNKTKNIELTANFNSVIFIIHGCIFIYRAIAIGLGTQVTDVFSPSLFNILPYLDALIVSLLWTFGFIMMVNQKLNAESNELRTHFELIFNTSPDASLISRLSDGMLIDCNEGFTRITGYTKEDISSKTTLSIQFWNDPACRNKMIELIEKYGFCENFESQFRRKNGSIFTGLLSAKEISINRSPHIISVTRDISERKDAEEEIKHKNEELNRLNREKDKIFSIIAHDLRMPFNGFLGLTSILAEKISEMSTAEIHKIAVSLRKSAQNVYRLLENLLEWSSLKQGLINFKPSVFSLRPVVNECLAILEDQVKLKNIEIICNIPATLYIYADIDMIKIVIRNLVSNAVKFTSRGGMVKISAESIENDTIRVSIKDNGIGMNPEIVRNLFDFDVNTNRKGTDNEPSTGLGLVLSKDFIEKNNGKLFVESEENNGSVFYFTLPSQP